MTSYGNHASILPNESYDQTSQWMQLYPEKSVHEQRHGACIPSVPHGTVRGVLMAL